jgi:hypothetical protein
MILDLIIHEKILLLIALISFSTVFSRKQKLKERRWDFILTLPLI